MRLAPLTAVLGLLAAPAWAQDATIPAATAQPTVDKSGYDLFHPVPDNQMRSFSTDRPNKSNSPYTLDAGHFQYETDLLGGSVDNYAAGGVRGRTLYTADPVLKLGVTNFMDVEVALGGYQDIRAQAPGERRTDVQGFGDVTLRAKLNLWGNDGGNSAFALIPYLKAPTASPGLGNGVAEGGLIAPLQLTLPANFTAILMTEFDALQNASDAGRHVGFINLVNLSHPITHTLSASVEFFSQAQAVAPTIYTADVSLAYLLGPNTQIDTAVYAGLNKAAPDAVAYVGLSQRF